MSTNNLLSEAAEQFAHSATSADIRPSRKRFLDNITCAASTDGLRVIKSIGGDNNNLIIMAGVDGEGHSGVIATSFVRKEAYFALQIISTLPYLVPDEQLMASFTFANKKEIVIGFAYPPTEVSGTTYLANYAQLTPEDLATFIGSELISWQLKSKKDNTVLSSDFTVLSADILPQSEVKYLIRSMARAIAADFLQQQPATNS